MFDRGTGDTHSLNVASTLVFLSEMPCDISVFTESLQQNKDAPEALLAMDNARRELADLGLLITLDPN